MREFFKGWRRKVGCVTLVMAVAFAGIWIAGLAERREVEFWVGQEVCILRSTPREIHIVKLTPFAGPYGMVKYESFSVEIHHEFVVIPLTLLSAYLILWKPRPKPRGEPNA